MDEEYTSDEGKRRRVWDKSEEVFNKSRKLFRTPIKNGQEGKIDKLTSMIQELMRDTKEIKMNQELYRKELDGVKQENRKLKAEIKEVKQELRLVKDGLHWIEKDKVKNNVIMTGIDLSTSRQEELMIEVHAILKKEMNLEVEIKDVVRMGTNAYKIELNSFLDKRRVMINKSKLRNSKNKIYINRELTKEEMRIQRRIKETAIEERNNGKKVKIGDLELTVEGKKWRWDRGDEKLKIWEGNDGNMDGIRRYTKQPSTGNTSKN